MKPRHKISKEIKATRLLADDLSDAIVALVKEGVSKSSHIAIRLGWSPSVILDRLEMLQELGEVHRTALLGCTGGARYQWNIGPLPEGLCGAETARRVQLKRSGEQVIVRSKTYPIVGRRDYMVAAIHGAPKLSNHAIQEVV